MVDTVANARNIFSQVEHIKISDIYHKSHGYFILISIGNFGNQVLPNPLVVSALQKLDRNSLEVKNFYDRLRSDMIAN